MRGALLPAAVIAFGLSAASASAADVAIKDFSFNPTPITVAPGDTVTWTWAGPDTNHSVTADPNQADSWDSDPGRTPSSADHLPGSTFDHTFSTAGTFTYHCKVHSFMTGKVVVRAPGSGPPPDTTAPTITGLKATGGRKCKPHAKHCKAKPTVVRFTLTEAGQVKITARGKTRASVAGKVGKNTVKLSTRKLPPGKYKLRVTATDAAGNASLPAKTGVRVKTKR